MVPVDKVIGGEFLYYKNGFDFALIRGLGRIGAAISPANNEETFFGPPSLEFDETRALRLENNEKYKSSKIALAGAFNAYRGKRTGLRRLELNVGLMARYNRDTQGILPGGGVSGILGPFTFGYSIYSDETMLEYDPMGSDSRPVVKYNAESVSAGFYLDSLILDYSVIRLYTERPMSVNVLTGSVLLKRFILTASWRNEKSDRSYYDYETKTLIPMQDKEAIFAGVQYRVAPFLMIGAFHNYYLVGDITLGTTLLF